MKLALRILLGLLCIPLLIAGGTALIDPLAMVDRFAVEPISTDGLAAIRGTYAGLLLSIVLMIFLGLFRRYVFWFLSAALLIGIVLFGRIVSIIFDGVGPDVFQHVVMETVMVSLLLLAYKRLAPEL